MANPRRGGWRGGLTQFEDVVASLCLAAMVLLPLAEILARNLLHTRVQGVTPLVQHLTLWVGFLGSAIAARDGKLLTFASSEFLREGRLRRMAEIFSGMVAATVAAVLCRGGIELVTQERGAGTMVTGVIPTWVAQLVLPVAFGLIGLRLVGMAKGWTARVLTTLGFVGGFAIAQYHSVLDGVGTGWGLGIILLGTLAGGPIFATLGGIAAYLFMKDGVAPAAVLVETYRLAVNPTLAALPLFTFVGFLLAEGNASQRLLRFFRAFFGWIPGGTALVCTLICVFFTIPTGGSGVTILALGGLLYQALRADGYTEKFSLGLLTGSGSLGLLLPPSLPLILYGIVAAVPIEDLFLGGIVPGVLLVILVAVWGMRTGIRTGIPRSRFEPREAVAAFWGAKWELAVPLVALVAIFSGLATVVEASALTVLYTFFTQVFVHRDIPFRRMEDVGAKCVAIIGGVILILGVAMGFSSYMVDAEVPANLMSWVQAHVDSQAMFLLLLNLFLLVVGCLLDIFSATVVVVPLIKPLGAIFGVDPIHMGIIFVANLELGYLTPPVGLNLFFSAYRFEKPVLVVTRAALPMLGILGIGVVLITYIPWITTGLLRILGR